MATLILCGLIDEENGEFLTAERALLDEIIAQKGLRVGDVHTQRLKQLPDPADTEKVNRLGLELLETYGLGAREFQTEFLEKNGFKFLAIHSAGQEMPAVVAPIPPAEKPKRPPLRIPWKIPALILGGLALLVLLYYGIGFLLTKLIDARYADGNCAGLVGMAGFVEKVYPVKIAPFTEPVREQAAECRAYLNAESLHEQKSWEQAYQAYRTYGETYPNGIHAKVAKELAADSLFELAVTQRGKLDHAGAVDNLTLILDEYADTPSAAKARATLPEVYLEWGQASRASGDFSTAESAYLSMREWATREHDDTLVTSAAAELARAYFEWGKALQEKKDFDTAFSKFNKAIGTDPTPDSADGTAAQTRAYLPGFQRAWGEYLLTSGKFAVAIDHLQTSLSLSGAKDVDSVKEILSLAYLQWAESQQKIGDYNGALKNLDLSTENAVTDANQGRVAEVRAATLDQFSRSTDAQALGVISAAAKSICKEGKPLADPPIIGVLEEKRLFILGLNLTTPDEILAKAPGSLHFVACAEEKEVTIQTCPYSKTGFGTMSHWIDRIRYDWVIKVYNSQTGKLYLENTFRGSSPETCPHTHKFSSTLHYHRGDKPSPTPIMDWLMSLIN